MSINSAIIIASASLALGVVGTNSPAAVLYGLDPLGDRLFSIETTTGQFSFLMFVPQHDIGGLGTASDGSLYMTQWNSGIGITHLHHLDVQNQSTQLIGPTPGSNFQSFEILGDVGYGIDFGQLRTVNLGTGAVANVGPISTVDTFINFGGLAGNGDTLYGYGRFANENVGRLISINRSTGAMIETLETTPTFNDDPSGLAYSDGALWGLHNFSLRRFDLQTRQWSTVFSGYPIQFGTGMTAAIPGPSSISMLALAVLAGTRRRSAQPALPAPYAKL